MPSDHRADVDSNCLLDADGDEQFAKELQRSRTGRGWLQKIPLRRAKNEILLGSMEELEISKRGIRAKF